MGIRVFVYGTLKEGHGNHRLLEQGNTRFLGHAVLDGYWKMISLGGFPGVVDGCDSLELISGEVYEVDMDTLRAMDLLEGHPTFYERRKVTTPYKKAWMYFLPQDFKDRYQAVSPGFWSPKKREEEFLNERLKAEGIDV